MKYNVYKKKIGVNPCLVSSFEIKDEVISQLFVENNELFILTQTDLFRFNVIGSDMTQCIEGHFSVASDFDYDPILKKFFVADSGGRTIHGTSYWDFSCSEFIVGNNQNFIHKTLSKYKTTDAAIAVDPGNGFYLSIRESHRIFRYFNSNLKCVAGDGHAGYCVGATANSTRFNYPSDIYFNGGRLYVADTGNHCIRSLCNDKVSLLLGCPSDLMEPKQIIKSNNITYYVSNNCVYSGSLIVFKSKCDSKKINICVNRDNDLYILEGE